MSLVPLLSCKRVLCRAATAGLPEGCCRARPSITTTTTTHQRTSIGMDPASRALAEGVPPGLPFSFRALADHSGVSHATLHRRSHGGPSSKQKGQDQQYLTPWEEEALVKFILQMANFSYPIWIKFIPLLAYRLTLQQPQSARPPKPPHIN
jgi:hypothetical protein